MIGWSVVDLQHATGGKSILIVIDNIDAEEGVGINASTPRASHPHSLV